MPHIPKDGKIGMDTKIIIIASNNSAISIISVPYANDSAVHIKTHVPKHGIRAAIAVMTFNITSTIRKIIHAAAITIMIIYKMKTINGISNTSIKMKEQSKGEARPMQGMRAKQEKITNITQFTNGVTARRDDEYIVIKKIRERLVQDRNGMDVIGGMQHTIGMIIIEQQHTIGTHIAVDAMDSIIFYIIPPISFIDVVLSFIVSYTNTRSTRNCEWKYGVYTIWKNCR